jgi:hypothetical protein
MATFIMVVSITKTNEAKDITINTPHCSKKVGEGVGDDGEESGTMTLRIF